MVVTAITMTLHIAVGLRKRIVLFDNVFNRHKFDLDGLGEVFEPPGGCMPSLDVETVFGSITRLLPGAKRRPR